jgi:hypothetical protein
LFNDKVDKDTYKSQRLKEQVACLPSKKGFIANIALVDMHLLIKKLISRVHYVQPIESKKLNINDIIKAFNKKDICNTKFINFACQLKDDKLNDKK